MLRPEFAIELLGIRLEFLRELKNLARANERYEIAGMIDRQSNQISISLKFPEPIARFTMAHELGHWVLHQDTISYHRDRPIDNIAAAQERAPEEKEADYYAATFLMPRILLTEAFEKAFMVNGPIVLNDATAFKLRPEDPEAFLEEHILQQAAVVASREKYDGNRFASLSKYFNVSVAAMARRLLELGLVKS